MKPSHPLMKDSLELAWHELNLHAVTITNPTAYNSPLPLNWLKFSAGGSASPATRYEPPKPPLPPKPKPTQQSPRKSPTDGDHHVRTARIPVRVLALDFIHMPLVFK